MTKTAKSVGAPKAETVRPPKRMAAPANATKKARLIALLSRKSGADVPGLSTTLGMVTAHDTGGAYGPAQGWL